MKKIIGILLCMTILAGLITVPAGAKISLGQPYLLYEDFDSNTVIFEDVELISDGSGGQYAISKATRANAKVSYPSDGRYVIEYDTMFADASGNVLENEVFVYDIGFTEYVESSFDFHLFPTAEYAGKGIELSKWYTVRISIDKAAGVRYNAGYGRIFGDAFTVEWKERGTDNWRSARNSHGSYDYSGTDLCYCIGRNFWQYVTTDTENDGIGFVGNGLIDNVKVYVPGAYATRLGFESAGKEVNTIPSGSVVGVANLENKSDRDEVVSGIVKAFNSRGEVIASTEYASWTVAANSASQYRTESLSVENFVDVEYVKLSVSKMSVDGVVELGEKSIYQKPVIVDDSTDGYVEWSGYKWSAQCIPPELPSDRIHDTVPCQHGFIYVDDNDYMNFRLQAEEGKEGRHHRIEIERNGESEENQVNLNDNFDYEFDMRVFDFGEALGYQHYGSDYRVYIVFTTGNIIYQTDEGMETKNIAVGYDWNTFRSEKRGMYYSLYMNDELLFSCKLPKLTSTNTKDGAIRFYGTPYKKIAPNFQLRRMELNEYEEVVEMTPDYDQKFAEGSDIDFNIEIDGTPERVDYYVGDMKIGSATAETNFTYTLKDAQRGSYKVYSKVFYPDGTEKHSFERNITVGTDVNISVVCPENINHGDVATLSVANKDNIEITSVDYYVNGIRVGSASENGFSFDVNSLKVGTSSVYAIVYFHDGSQHTTEKQYINVVASGEQGSLDIGQEYDLSYNFGGGQGKMILKDGHFELNMTHNGEGVTYQTLDEGAKTYAAPAGKYRAIVTAGVADIYRDGQLAFSYFMPRCTDDASLGYSGVSNVELKGSGVKAEVLRRKISGEREVNAENINMGLYYSLEFDKTDASSETIHLYDGEYEISVKFNGGISVMEQPRSEWAVGERKLCDTVEPGYYRITVYRGLAQLFRNNKFLGSFRCYKTSHKTELRRVMSKPGATTFVAIKNTEDIFYYEDDFEGDNDMPSEEYWYTFWGAEKPVVEGGKLKLANAGTYLLDATAENPKYTWDMALALSEVETEVETEDPAPGGSGGGGCEGQPAVAGVETVITKSGQVSINFRFRNEYNNMRIVYDHSKGEWSLVSTTSAGTSTIATTSKSISPDVTYGYVLDIKKDKLTFSCGDEKIFDAVPITFYGNGKFGFTITDCGATIDNVTYAGNGKTNTGVYYEFWPTTKVGGTLEFVDLDSEQEGMVGVYFLEKMFKSTDNGDTWSDAEDYRGKGFAANSIILRSGRKLSVSDWGGQSHAALYEPDGTSVYSNHVVQKPDDSIVDRHAMQGRLTQGRKVWGNATEPRIYYVTSEGTEANGTTRVYFSDDEGSTWTESRTDMSYKALGDFYAGEADIVELSDGTVRVWLRCDRGFLYYLDSFDGGLNFELKPHASQLMTPSTAFSIERDSEDPETYYIIWTNDTSTAALQYIQHPRNRESIAVSHDGTKTWEYIMEMDDRGIYPSTAFCNASMRVIDGIVYANHGYLEGGQFKMDESTIINQVTYTLDPARFKTVKRFANAHYIVTDFRTIYDDIPGQAILPKSTGSALLYGSYFPARVDGNGFVETAIVAKAVGAKVTATETGIQLSIGDGVVAFEKGSAMYNLNGTEYTADEVCLSEDGTYMNPEICAKIFGKNYSETDSAHILVNAAFSEVAKDELESFVSGASEKLRLCIEDFKAIINSTDLKNFFNEYKTFLNLDVNFTDKSYGNMYNAYTELILESIADYETLAGAIDTLTAAEKGRVGEFLAALNSATENGDCAAIETLLTQTYADLISFVVDTVEVASGDAVYRKMMGITYYSVEDVETAFKAALTAQIYAESGKSNAISLSTASNGIEGWIYPGSADFGGVSMKRVGDDNVITLSAYEKIIDDRKAEVEAPFGNSLVYHNPGQFDSNTVTKNGVAVDGGAVTFGSGDGILTLTGSDYAKSNTVIYVFDMTKPDGQITATFDSGFLKKEIVFDGDSCSFGTLPEALQNAEKLTYRVELSQTKITVYVKTADAEDREYVRLGEATESYHSKTKWSVKFAGNANATISDLGVYSALSSVKYDIAGYEIVDDIYYGVDGGEGHTIEDLIATGRTEDGTVAEDGSLKLIEGSGATPPRGTLIYTTGHFSGSFDRAVYDWTIQIETGGSLFLYMLDGSGFRMTDGSFSPDRWNASSAYSGLKWETGQYYDIRIITSPAGYDENGQTVTSGCMYVKREEDTEWICIAQDIITTKGDINEGNLQLALMNCRENEAVYIKKFGMKTYAITPGNYEFANTSVNVPDVDYVFSYDYMRMDRNTPTQFTIGGEDYCQSFTIEPYRIVSNATDYVTADVNVDTDEWYRIFGTVEMTGEATQAFDKTKIVKNKITMYMEDADGNITTLFKDLPMLKKTGSNGLRFRMSDTTYAGIRLKNVRIYNGKALDLISATAEGGSAVIVADFLNDSDAYSDSVTMYSGVYGENGFLGAKTEAKSLTLDKMGYVRLSMENIKYTVVDDKNIEMKLFVWKDAVPLTAPAESR